MFSLGLMLVIVGGAALLTDNNLMVMAWASGKMSTGQVIRNWMIVYAGNVTGTLATAAGLYLSQQWTFAAYEVGVTAVKIAVAKVSDGFLGICPRRLRPCLGVPRRLVVFQHTHDDRHDAGDHPPMTAFVTAGFEPSIAHRYFIPLALFLRGVRTSSNGWASPWSDSPS